MNARRIHLKQKHNQKQKGFTLIEAMVVLLIIGTLAAVVLVQNREIQRRARDAKRVADIGMIQLALELFRDQYGHYPGPAVEGVPATGEKIGVGGAIDIALAPYLNMLVPRDPMHDPADPAPIYYYSYDPQHCAESVTGICLCNPTDRRAVMGINQFESPKPTDRQTNCGGNQNLHNASYNRVLPQQGP